MEDEFEMTVERRRELYRWGLLAKVSLSRQRSMTKGKEEGETES